MIKRFCFDEQLLLPSVAEEAFGAEKMAAVREIRRSTFFDPVDLRKTEPHEHKPSCYGIPHVEHDKDPVCASCLWHNQCVASAKASQRVLKTVYGTDDPAEKRRRRVQAERQARCRARKKAAASVTHPGSSEAIV
jgi:hypothetical protein